MTRSGQVRTQTSGEEVANTVTHVVGSHLGAAMLALLCLCLISLTESSYNPFLYFHF